MSTPEPAYRDRPPTTTYSYQATAHQHPPLLTWSVPTTPVPAAPPTNTNPTTNLFQPQQPPLQTWSTQTSPVSAAPPANTSTSTAANFFQPRLDTCAFCRAQGHRIRACAITTEYINSGRASIVEDRIHLPNSQPIPFDSSRRGLQASIDIWLAVQTATAPVQTHAVFAQEPPPHFNSHNTPTSRIEEVIETHIIQVKEGTTTGDDQAFPHNIFKGFATEKKKPGGKHSKAPELLAPAPMTPPPVVNTSTSAVTPQTHTQYRYQSHAEDQ